MVIWLNGIVGAGKSAVARALATILTGATYVDGDHHAGPSHLPHSVQWRMALDVLLRLVSRRKRTSILVVAYPLRRSDYVRLRSACGRAHRRLVVVTVAPPLTVTLRGRGGRELDDWERKRVRRMVSEGYHRRRFAALTVPNAQSPAMRTACLLAHRVRILRRAAHRKPSEQTRALQPLSFEPAL
jgi:hypothetical protein